MKYSKPLFIASILFAMLVLCGCDMDIVSLIDGDIDIVDADSIDNDSTNQNTVDGDSTDNDTACTTALPLLCGDRLNHDTSIQGRENEWQAYNCTARLESGRETIYSFETDKDYLVRVRLNSLYADLDLFLLTACDSFTSTKCASTPLDIPGIESINFVAKSGQKYFVVVDGYNEAAGTYKIDVDCIPCSIDRVILCEEFEEMGGGCYITSCVDGRKVTETVYSSCNNANCTVNGCVDYCEDGDMDGDMVDDDSENSDHTDTDVSIERAIIETICRDFFTCRTCDFANWDQVVGRCADATEEYLDSLATDERFQNLVDCGECLKDKTTCYSDFSPCDTKCTANQIGFLLDGSKNHNGDDGWYTCLTCAEDMINGGMGDEDTFSVGFRCVEDGMENAHCVCTDGYYIDETFETPTPCTESSRAAMRYCLGFDK